VTKHFLFRSFLWLKEWGGVSATFEGRFPPNSTNLNKGGWWECLVPPGVEMEGIPLAGVERVQPVRDD